LLRSSLLFPSSDSSRSSAPGPAIRPASSPSLHPLRAPRPHMGDGPSREKIRRWPAAMAQLVYVAGRPAASDRRAMCERPRSGDLLHAWSWCGR
jgi:hypothetical protein